MKNPGEYIKIGNHPQKEIEEFIKKHEFIYRYLPIEYLLDTLQKKTLTFINPIKWNDPFDNFMFKLEKEGDTSSFTSQLFCQCLTLNPHSQAYWKTYGGDGYSARLKIKTEKFIELIGSKNDQFWIGRMKYLKEGDLIENIKKIENLKDDLSTTKVTKGFLKAFFLKRKPFEYENEIRFLIKSKATKNELKKIKFKNLDIVKEIRLDPRMGSAEETAFKEYLSKFEIKVTKSHLFKSKKIF